LLVAIADRYTTAGYRPWRPNAQPAAPSAGVTDDSYVGKHRKPEPRGFSLFRMFYKPRHRL
jgi:hypothetical protein